MREERRKFCAGCTAIRCEREVKKEEREEKKERKEKKQRSEFLHSFSPQNELPLYMDVQWLGNKVLTDGFNVVENSIYFAAESGVERVERGD
jgi:hypothetical protein